MTFFIAYEDAAGPLNKTANEERRMSKDKFSREELYNQSQLECNPIEEELFTKSSSENGEGVGIVTKVKTPHRSPSALPHTNYRD